jgi:hypothetical protein
MCVGQRESPANEATAEDCTLATKTDSIRDRVRLRRIDSKFTIGKR